MNLNEATALLCILDSDFIQPINITIGSFRRDDENATPESPWRLNRVSSEIWNFVPRSCQCAEMQKWWGQSASANLVTLPFMTRIPILSDAHLSGAPVRAHRALCLSAPDDSSKEFYKVRPVLYGLSFKALSKLDLACPMDKLLLPYIPTLITVKVCWSPTCTFT